MRGDRRLRVLLVAPMLVIALLAGCAPRAKAPPGWLPDAHEACRDPYGGWIRLQVVPGTEGAAEADVVDVERAASWEFETDDPAEPRPATVPMIQGEFLGIDADSAYVLVADDRVRAVALADVEKAEVAFFDPMTGNVQAWAALGGISTLSHGVYLGISLPFWIGIGTATASNHARQAIKRLDDDDWLRLRAYARFPQGPPPRLRDLHLHARPAPGSPPPKKEW
jgi:hypothetical protein